MSEPGLYQSLDCITFFKVLVFIFMVKSQKISSIDYCDAGEFNLKSIYLKSFRFSFIVSSFVGKTLQYKKIADG